MVSISIISFQIVKFRTAAGAADIQEGMLCQQAWQNSRCLEFSHEECLDIGKTLNAVCLGSRRYARMLPEWSAQRRVRLIVSGTFSRISCQ
jgi:hypothetical protein